MKKNGALLKDLYDREMQNIGTWATDSECFDIASLLQTPVMVYCSESASWQKFPSNFSQPKTNENDMYIYVEHGHDHFQPITALA